MNVPAADASPHVTVACAVPGSVSELTHQLQVRMPLAFAVSAPSPLAWLVYPLGRTTVSVHDSSALVVRALRVS